eukprot:3198494-Pyramimonas_sp.AAC.1
MPPSPPNKPLRRPKTAQEGPERPRKDLTGGSLCFCQFLARASFQPSECPRRRKRPPRGPQNRPRSLQDGSRTAQAES